MLRPTTRLRWVYGALVLMAAAWAGALDVVDAPTVEASPGEYVTLPFVLKGEGEFEYRVTAPEPWQPLNPSGRVTLDGEGFVSVTFKVPPLAPAGSETTAEVTFTSTNDPTVHVTARAVIVIAENVKIDLVTPDELQGRLDQPLILTVLVANLGNIPDEVTLSGNAGMFDLRVEANRLDLAPGERREVGVVVTPTGQVSSGYRNTIRLIATSGNDPDVTVRAAIRSTYVSSSFNSQQNDAADPRLTLAIHSGLTGALSIDADGIDPSLRWDVNPRLTGDLSDYVSASAGIGAYSGSLVDPFEQVPSGLDLALTAESWNASTSLRPGSYSLSGGGNVGAWRIGGGADYQHRAGDTAFGVNAFGVSQLPELDLQLAGRTRVERGQRNDSISAQYRTPLATGFVLSAGTQLVGAQTADGYAFGVGINESLTWQNQLFDVTQSYSGAPLSGIHNLGLSGGMRSGGWFSVRASTALQMAPAGNRWRNTLTVSSRPVQGLGLGVAFSYDQRNVATTWGVRPSVSYRFRLGPVLGGASASYAHTGVLVGDLATVDRYSAGLSFRVGPASLNTNTSYQTSSSTSTRPSSQRFTLGLGGDYRLGLRSTVSADYQYSSETLDGTGESELTVRWLHDWLPTLRTGLSYERNQRTAYQTGLTRLSERVVLIANLDDLVVDGLDLSVGYGVGSDGGLFTGITPLTHDISARLGYTFQVSFDTPVALVNTFGGRRGGEVRGVAFLDRNLNGVLDEGEALIDGLEVILGDESAATGPTGSYRVRVPEGTYSWSFGEGIPGQVAAFIDPTITVDEDTVTTIDIPFVPVVSLRVSLFEDADHDAERGDTETGISFGGVLVEGPIERSVRLDARGEATVSGLIPGTYTVRPDPERLPAGFSSTTPPATVELREGMTGNSVQVGAAGIKREQVTTFTSNDLAVIAMINRSSVEAGSDVTVTALVTGNAASVTVQVLGMTVELEPSSGRWLGTLTIPEAAPEGQVTLTITAIRGDQTAQTEVNVMIR